MKRFFKPLTTLTLGLILSASALAQETKNEVALFEPGDSQFASQVCYSGECDSNGSRRSNRRSNPRSNRLINFDRNGNQRSYFFGVEYRSTRAHFSQAIAYVERNKSITAPVDTIVNHDFDFEDSVRFYGGYRLDECGEEVRFSYSDFNSSASSNSAAVPTNTSFEYLGPLEVVAVLDGESISSSFDVGIKNFDLAFAKTIPLGSPLACGDCGNSCGDSCNSCCDSCCPSWDITWSAGVRVAEVDWTRNTRLVNPATTSNSQLSSRTTMNFNGAGLRAGLEGRRYFGRGGIASLYIKSDLSLLLGNVDIVGIQTNNTNSPTQRFSNTRIIPVIDMEVGANVQVTSNMNVSAGYLFSAWHDLGVSEEYDFGLPSTYDDANILGFDGFFLRSEISF